MGKIRLTESKLKTLIRETVEMVLNEACYDMVNGQTVVTRDKQNYGPNPQQILSQPPKCNGNYGIRDLHDTLGERQCQTLGGVAQYFKKCASYGSVGNSHRFFRIFVNKENLDNALKAGAITQQERNMIVRIYNQDIASNDNVDEYYRNMARGRAYYGGRYGY